MGTITWNTEVNAPCCPGEILSDDGQSILIQTDWDFPGVASSFGWNMMDVQKMTEDDCQEAVKQPCQHEATDGTVDCKECGMTATEFISAARDYLARNDGATADDPGYFGN